jgi:hypothetical protein
VNIGQALDGVDQFLTLVEVETNKAVIGAYADAYFDELRYVFEFAKTIREVQTTHDSKAEGESWDQFFAERKALADGKS